MEHVEDEIYVKNLLLIGNEVYILKEHAKRATQSMQKVYTNCQKAKGTTKKQEGLQNHHSPSPSAQLMKEAN